MTAQHTPGPWTLNPARSTRVDLIDNAKGHAIGEIVWVDVRNPADAQLIAAAPALLVALHAALDAVDADRAQGIEPPDWYGLARAAVACAVGD